MGIWVKIDVCRTQSNIHKHDCPEWCLNRSNMTLTRCRSKLVHIFCAYANKVRSFRSTLFWIRIIAETRYLLFLCNQDMENKSPPAARNTIAESPRGGLLKNGLVRSQWVSSMPWDGGIFRWKLVLLSGASNDTKPSAAYHKTFRRRKLLCKSILQIKLRMLDFYSSSELTAINS
jgi:hypothetical protein